MRVVILGPPGAGKGTQAVMLAEKAGIPHISTGEMLRAATKSGSELGKQVEGIMSAGDLVPDDVMIEVIRERLSQDDCANGFLLDGYPRTVDQAESLSTLLSEIGMELTHVLELEVSEQVLLDRIKKRGEQGSGRSDDSLEVAANRLKVYWEKTAPVTKFYRDGVGVFGVDGLGTIDEVKERINTATGLV